MAARARLYSLGKLVLGGLVAACMAAPAVAVDLLSENFDELPLQQVVTFQSETRDRAAWTTNVPSGAGVQGAWSIDNSAMPTEAADPLIGVAEFEGWSFVDKDWWIDTAGNQDRVQFVSASGTIAVADPDEWDDFGSPNSPTSYGNFDSTLRVSNIPLQGAAPNSVNLFFHSSWRYEGVQKASLTVKYDDPATTEIPLFQWESDPNSPNFKDDATNEALTVPLLNPTGANNATLEFRLFDAGNNWWWAIDNLQMFTGAAPAQDGVLRLVIDRGTREVKILNNTPGTINLRGYSIESREGTLLEGVADFLGNGDADWQILSSGDSSSLSEGYIPNQYAMPTAAANPTLGVIDLGAAWEQYHEDIDDVTFEYLVAGSDEPVVGVVEFVGNGGQSFDPLDLNFDGAISLLDYETFLAGYGSDLTNASAAQGYNMSDLDRDGKHTVADFQEFKRVFDQQRGPGAFAAMVASASTVPEPSTLVGLTFALGALIVVRRRRKIAAVPVLLACSLAATHASAALPLLVEDFESVPLGQSPEEQPTQFGVWNGDGPTGWTIDRSAMPGLGDPATDGVADWAGWAVAKKDWWVAVAGDQERSQYSRGVGAVLIADPDEWDDANHDVGFFETYITTPMITIPAGIPAGKVKIAFDSSWRPEGFDDGPILGQQNNQTATLDVSYDGGAYQNLLTWDSQDGGPNFKPDSTNEAVELDAAYNGSSTSIQVRFGLSKAVNDWWWALDNVRVYVPSEPSILRINTTTGFAEIAGGDVIPETINGFDIASDNGNLAPTGNLGLSYLEVDTVDGPDGDATPGSTLGENWQLASASDNLFSEFFLDGSSTFTDSRTESLGRIFNPATAELDRDVTFTYSTIFGDVVTGVVEYVSGGATADFNGDGKVSGSDFLIWQRGAGVGTTLAQGDADGDSDVDAADLAVWQGQYGLGAAVPSTTSVPEPAAWGLALFVGSVLCLQRSRRLAAGVIAALVLLAGSISDCLAQVIPSPTVDRDYRLGDTDPGATNGGNVTVTRDNAGQLGMNQLIDMTANSRAGGPAKYVTISGRPDGGGGLGIALNPNPTDRQYLRTGADEALNFPERSPSSTEGTLPGGTIDYTFITDRGFQLWVQPYQATPSHIVMDTNNHGVLIDAAGNFGMRYSGFDYAGLTSVAPNQWYHLMVVRAFGDRGSGSVLYVDGVAEAAATGIYNGEDAPNDEMNPANHDNGPLVIGSTTSESPFQIGTGQYFHGVVDDLSMFVMGLNNTADYGEFELARDNDYVAHFGPSTDGDLNGDDLITMTDVTTFASNWLYEKTLTWEQSGELRTLVVGDLESRTRGDFNYDGRVDLADWGILNTANPAMAAVAMQLISAVPEPGTWTLAFFATFGLAARLRRRRAR